MSNLTRKLSQSHDVSAKVAQLLQTRTRLALERFNERAQQAREQVAGLTANPTSLSELWAGGAQYGVDFAQRSILFWDTLRQRGNNFVEHERQGLPPVLRFDYEIVMDGRSFKRPVNYALLRIVPPKGVTVDAKRRPYVIIDPRGGHGPGIGGFKDDSQVGVALHEGHPVYFVIFFPNPEPGQTLLDVCDAEREFVHRVRELHPDAPKPGIVGNCQAGWAAMMLAAANPDDTGPIVIVGAPMSYWGGAWSEGEGDNPMRYAGGLLGGTWLASLTSDLGAGKFDGAYLVQNFENLNPANTFWDKYYQVFANVDTEAARFLEFERWWGGYFLLNREEIEWITQNLFVGNKLWSGAVKAGPSKGFDLRDIKVPIVLFASAGDNITPPQQAFNWVADVYGSTEEIKARGQVIVGLMHEDVGHLGIFVSGKVAKKEGTQIASVLKSIEALPPGLYGMQIAEQKDRGGKPAYEVSFVELRLEEIVARLNRFKRADERPFEAVKAVAEFNQRAYELFGRPLVQALSNEYGAKLSREFHPLRLQRWAISDLNPWLWWLAPAAQAVKAQRQALGAGRSGAQARVDGVGADERFARLLSRTARRGCRSHVLPDLRQPVRLLLERRAAAPKRRRRRSRPARASVRQGSAGFDRQRRLRGGARARRLPAGAQGRAAAAFPAAARARADRRVPRVAAASSRPTRLRRIGGEQEIIARYEPEKAVETLPVLVAEPKDRDRLLTLLERVLADQRVQRIQPSAEQKAMLARIRRRARRRGAPAGRVAARFSADPRQCSGHGLRSRASRGAKKTSASEAALGSDRWT